ncbi:MAG: dihydroorotase [Candidatus Binataceae bacterium]
MRPLFLRGGRVLDPSSAIDGVFDLLMADGEIEAMESAGSLQPPRDAIILDVAGLWVVPGLIDPHVHLRDPGFPHKETILSGLRAAAAGGFTMVAAMANTSPVNDTPEITRYMLERAHEARAARLIPVSAVTKGLEGRETVDFAAMVAAGVRLFSDDGIPIDDQVVLARAFDEAARIGFAISLHEEDRALTGEGAVNAGEVSRRLGVAGIPAVAESKRIRRDLALAIGSGAPVHIAHVSTADGIAIVRAARRNGAAVSCEVTPHHLALDEGAVMRWGQNAKMSPPLRGAYDVAAIEAAVADGNIDMIATDHAPHDPVSKQAQYLNGFFGAAGAKPLAREQIEALTLAANGIVGLETAVGVVLGLVHRGIITPARMIEMMSVNPARLLHCDAGTLAVGARADITVIDPDSEWTVDANAFISKSRNTPFAGMRMRGRAVMTIVGGEIVHNNPGVSVNR